MQMQTDTERMNRLQLAGYVVLQFTYLDVVEVATHVLPSINTALAR
jgi:very-short-patch-repair endonuclease